MAGNRSRSAPGQSAQCYAPDMDFFSDPGTVIKLLVTVVGGGILGLFIARRRAHK